MILRMGLLDKKSDWTTERFCAHWQHQHAALARQLPELVAYHQNHVTDCTQRGIHYKRGEEAVDGISQLWFRDDASMARAFTGPLAQRLQDDEEHFIGRLRIVAAETHTVVEPPMPGTALKRMSFLRRRPDVSVSHFADEWRAVHGPLVSAMPGVLGYRQNLVTQRESPKGTAVPYEQLPIDGIVELWFASPASLDAAFSSQAGLATMAHARTFIDAITTFLVDHVVVR